LIIDENQLFKKGTVTCRLGTFTHLSLQELNLDEGEMETFVIGLGSCKEHYIQQNAEYNALYYITPPKENRSDVFPAGWISGKTVYGLQYEIVRLSETNYQFNYSWFIQ
jgi:hypothetical protein